MKICIAASSGGHLSQILRIQAAFSGIPHFYLVSQPVPLPAVVGATRVIAVGEANREHPLRVLRVFFWVARAILTERPSVVISTGAAPGCLACMIGKSLGARVIWIDSIANTERLSLSGRIIRPFADLVLSQWPEVAASLRGVQYVGTVL